jgi:hypothetical protein
MRALRIAGVATVLAIVSFLFLMLRRERRTPRPDVRPAYAERRT